jgi:hypothetical protein
MIKLFLLNFILNSGVFIAGVPPLPIPNREVKPRRADGTIWATVWESRTMPDFVYDPVPLIRDGIFFCYFSYRLWYEFDFYPLEKFCIFFHL